MDAEKKHKSFEEKNVSLMEDETLVNDKEDSEVLILHEILSGFENGGMSSEKKSDFDLHVGSLDGIGKAEDDLDYEPPGTWFSQPYSKGVGRAKPDVYYRKEPVSTETILNASGALIGIEYVLEIQENVKDDICVSFCCVLCEGILLYRSTDDILEHVKSAEHRTRYLGDVFPTLYKLYDENKLNGYDGSDEDSLGRLASKVESVIGRKMCGVAISVDTDGSFELMQDAVHKMEYFDSIKSVADLGKVSLEQNILMEPQSYYSDVIGYIGVEECATSFKEAQGLLEKNIAAAEVFYESWSSKAIIIIGDESCMNYCKWEPTMNIPKTKANLKKNATPESLETLVEQNMEKTFDYMIVFPFQKIFLEETKVGNDIPPFLSLKEDADDTFEIVEHWKDLNKKWSSKHPHAKVIFVGPQLYDFGRYNRYIEKLAKAKGISDLCANDFSNIEFVQEFYQKHQAVKDYFVRENVNFISLIDETLSPVEHQLIMKSNMSGNIVKAGEYTSDGVTPDPALAELFWKSLCNFCFRLEYEMSSLLYGNLLDSIRAKHCGLTDKQRWSDTQAVVVGDRYTTEKLFNLRETAMLPRLHLKFTDDFLRGEGTLDCYKAFPAWTQKVIEVLSPEVDILIITELLHTHLDECFRGHYTLNRPNLFARNNLELVLRIEQATEKIKSHFTRLKVVWLLPFPVSIKSCNTVVNFIIPTTKFDGSDECFLGIQDEFLSKIEDLGRKWVQRIANVSMINLADCIWGESEERLYMDAVGNLTYPNKFMHFQLEPLPKFVSLIWDKIREEYFGLCSDEMYSVKKNREISKRNELEEEKKKNASKDGDFAEEDGLRKLQKWSENRISMENAGREQLKKSEKQRKAPAKPMEVEEPCEEGTVVFLEGPPQINFAELLEVALSFGNIMQAKEFKRKHKKSCAWFEFNDRDSAVKMVQSGKYGLKGWGGEFIASFAKCRTINAATLTMPAAETDRNYFEEYVRVWKRMKSLRAKFIDSSDFSDLYKVYWQVLVDAARPEQVDRFLSTLAARDITEGGLGSQARLIADSVLLASSPTKEVKTSISVAEPVAISQEPLPPMEGGVVLHLAAPSEVIPTSPDFIKLAMRFGNLIRVKFFENTRKKIKVRVQFELKECGEKMLDYYSKSNDISVSKTVIQSIEKPSLVVEPLAGGKGYFSTYLDFYEKCCKRKVLEPLVAMSTFTEVWKAYVAIDRKWGTAERDILDFYLNELELHFYLASLCEKYDDLPLEVSKTVEEKITKRIKSRNSGQTETKRKLVTEHGLYEKKRRAECGLSKIDDQWARTKSEVNKTIKAKYALEPRTNIMIRLSDKRKPPTEGRESSRPDRPDYEPRTIPPIINQSSVNKNSPTKGRESSRPDNKRSQEGSVYNQFGSAPPPPLVGSFQTKPQSLLEIPLRPKVGAASSARESFHNRFHNEPNSSSYNSGSTLKNNFETQPNRLGVQQDQYVGNGIQQRSYFLRTPESIPTGGLYNNSATRKSSSRSTIESYFSDLFNRPPVTTSQPPAYLSQDLTYTSQTPPYRSQARAFSPQSSTNPSSSWPYLSQLSTALPQPPTYSQPGAQVTVRSGQLLTIPERSRTGSPPPNLSAITSVKEKQTDRPNISSTQTAVVQPNTDSMAAAFKSGPVGTAYNQPNKPPVKSSKASPIRYLSILCELSEYLGVMGPTLTKLHEETSESEEKGMDSIKILADPENIALIRFVQIKLKKALQAQSSDEESKFLLGTGIEACETLIRMGSEE